MANIVRLFNTTLQAETAYRKFISEKAWRFETTTSHEPFIATMKSGENYYFMSVYRYSLWNHRQDPSFNVVYG